jgi:aryl-alcohol dehydrogenase-like predicted oxidoreductase
MEQRPFGRTGRTVSALGLGTWAMGGDEWGPSDDARSRAVLRAAVEAGVTLIDTADVYGLGHSEALIGEAVPPDEPAIVVTKGGWDITTDPPVVGGARRRYDRAYLESAVEASLRRLRRQVLDVYLLHNPTRADHDADAPMATLRRLRDRGLVRHVGASVGAADDALAAIEHGVEVLEVPFNVVRPWARDVLTTAAARGVAVIAREPFERGLLTGKYGTDATFPPGDHRNDKGRDWLAAAQPHAARVREVADRRGVPPAAVALAFPLSYPEVAVVIAGARAPEQLLANVAAAEMRLTAEELAFLADRAG